MATTYSLDTILAIAISLGSVCIVIMGVLLIIVLRYQCLAAREKRALEMIRTGDYRRRSASSSSQRHYRLKRIESNRLCMDIFCCIPPISLVSSEKRRDQPRVSESREQQHAENTDHRGSRENATRSGTSGRNSISSNRQAMAPNKRLESGLISDNNALKSNRHSKVQNDYGGCHKKSILGYPGTNALGVHTELNNSLNSQATSESPFVLSRPVSIKGSQSEFSQPGSFQTRHEQLKNLQAPMIGPISSFTVNTFSSLDGCFPKPPDPPFKSPSRSARTSDSKQHQYQNQPEIYSNNNEDSEQEARSSLPRSEQSKDININEAVILPPERSALRPKGAYKGSEPAAAGKLEYSTPENSATQRITDIAAEKFAQTKSLVKPQACGREGKPQFMKTEAALETPTNSPVSTPMVTPLESLADYSAAIPNDRNATPTKNLEIGDMPRSPTPRHIKSNLHLSNWSKASSSPGNIMQLTPPVPAGVTSNLGQDPTEIFQRQLQTQSKYQTQPYNSDKWPSPSLQLQNNKILTESFGKRNQGIDLNQGLQQLSNMNSPYKPLTNFNVQNSDHPSENRLLDVLLKSENIHQGSERIGRTQVDRGHSTVPSFSGSLVAPNTSESRNVSNLMRPGNDIQELDNKQRLDSIYSSSNALHREDASSLSHCPTPPDKMMPTYFEELDQQTRKGSGGSELTTNKGLVADNTQRQERYHDQPELAYLTENGSVAHLRPAPTKKHEHNLAENQSARFIVSWAENIENAVPKADSSRDPREHVKLSSPLRISKSTVSSTSRRSSLASSSLLSRSRLTSRPLQGSSDRENIETKQYETGPSSSYRKPSHPSHITSSIRSIAALQPPPSPRCPGYQPGQGVMQEVGKKNGKNNLGSLEHESEHTSKSMKRRSTFAYGHDQSKTSRVEASQQAKQRITKSTQINKPLPSTPFSLEDGVVVNLAGTKFIANYSYVAQLNDEMDLHYGDVVRVYEVFDDGWCLSRLIETSESKPGRNSRGVCPRSCLAEMEPI